MGSVFVGNRGIFSAALNSAPAGTMGREKGIGLLSGLSDNNKSPLL